MSWRTSVVIFIGLWVLAFVVVFMIFPTPKAHSYNHGGSYEDRLETPIQPVGYQYGVRKDVPMRIDRYEAPDWRSDPTVLVALPNPKPVIAEVKERTIIKYVVEKPEEPVKVTAEFEEE